MTTVIHWFRQDLRLSDNPAFSHATSQGIVLPVYILEDDNPMGAASRWWLHHSLRSLWTSLDQNLSLYRGDPLDILTDLIRRYQVRLVSWTRCYEPWRIEQERRLKEEFGHLGVQVQTANGSLLWEPWSIVKDDGTPYRVFTPFYRKGCLGAQEPRMPLDPLKNIRLIQDPSLTLEELRLLPKPRWDKTLEPHWAIGEANAQERLSHFLQTGLPHYKEGRNFPAKPYVSRLSPHLHFGEISPNQVWWAARSLGEDKNIDHFCFELGWREFSYSLLYHNPDLPWKNLQSKFDHFPWKEEDSAALKAWRKGQTGIPLVDGGMRELWLTGYMHNRVRMIVGSFLVKNLLIHWRHGERWFWDCLVDADLANNSASWQWIAGCGADAVPYFRIFNPVTQGQKFDPNGEYVRRFVPEISALPDAYLFCPWQAPPQVRKTAGVILGETYPEPIVDLPASRERALRFFDSLR